MLGVQLHTKQVMQEQKVLGCLDGMLVTPFSSPWTPHTYMGTCQTSNPTGTATGLCGPILW